MRPYLAIIKDSFRAAMASRVLYVLLALITILLLALAPLHMRETLDWKLSRDFNVPTPERVMRQIVDNKETKPGKRVWELLPESLRTRIDKTIANANSDSSSGSGSSENLEEIFLQEEMIVQLNKIIENPGFYRAEDWQDKPVPNEAQEFIDSGVDQLTAIRSKRLNRLLLSRIFPSISQGNASALQFKYAIWEFPAPLSMTHDQFGQWITTNLPWYFEKIVLSIGLLIAIIVTANMIPETFEAGSLNLLLSKPISRWGLFTAKFAGGCVFIALCAGYLFLGVWLWLGVGMQVWDRAILLSIPLYVIVFAIYFSVSAVVGLIWRSATVSVILTLLFWSICFSVGSGFYFFDTKMQNSELVSLLPVEDKVYPSDLLHQVLDWNEEEDQWSELVEAGIGVEGKMQFGINSFFVPLRDLPAMPGLSSHLEPIYDASASRVYASRYDMGRAVTSGRKRMLVADSGGKLEFKNVGEFPRDTVKIVKSKNGIIAITTNGFFHRLNDAGLETKLASAPLASEGLPKTDIGPSRRRRNRRNRSDEPEPVEPEVTKSESDEPEESTNDVETKKEENESDEEATTPVEPKVVVNLWDRIGPRDSFSVSTSNHVGYSSSRDEFVIFRRGTLKFYRFKDGKYDFHASLELALDFDNGMTSRMAYSGETILIAFGNGAVITVDAETMKEKNEYQPERRSALESVAASENGKYFAILYRNGNLWMLDTGTEDTISKAKVKGQGRICAFAFGGSESLWVSDNTDRATEYDLSTNSVKVRRSPKGDWVKRFYRYGLRPIYQACPKPGEFYKVVTHLSSSGDTEVNEGVDMNKTIQAADPWLPLWSGLGFMFCMLFIGCTIFHFKDY